MIFYKNDFFVSSKKNLLHMHVRRVQHDRQPFMQMSDGDSDHLLVNLLIEFEPLMIFYFRTSVGGKR